MTNLASSFYRYVRSRQASEFQRRVAELAAEKTLDRDTLVAASREAGMHDISEATDDLLDLLLYYIRLSLSDHELSGGEMTNIRATARLFQVEEGDLLARRGDEVAELVGAEMRHILLDNEVDTEEAARKVRLQEALGLSYDQFVELSRPLIDGAVADLLARASEAAEANPDWVQRRISALDTVYRMDGLIARQAAEALRTSEGRRGAEGKAGRPGGSITQEVREMAWARDRGRCTECGGEAGLDVHHIIPERLGGSGAFRNVQLLCEECAGRKAGGPAVS